MTVAFVQGAALALTGLHNPPVPLVERWYEVSLDAMHIEGASTERRELRVWATKALDRSRSAGAEARMLDDPDACDTVSPPLVVSRCVSTRFRRIAPLAPPSLDPDDFPR